MKHLFFSAAILLTSACVIPDRATAFETDIGLAYSIWFQPPEADEPDPPPLTIQDQVRYCAIAEQWSRRIWEVTDGSHLIYKVNFYSGYEQQPSLPTVYWRRWDGEAGTSFDTGTFNMFEGGRKCDPVFDVEGDEITGHLVCPEAGQTCSSDVLSDYRTARCMEGSEQVQQTPEELGWTMAHENGHSHYTLQDEYAEFGEATFPVCLGLPDNAGTDETSMMGWRGRNHWCDLNTHVHERALTGENGEVLLDSDGNPFIARGHPLVHEEGAWAAADESAYRWEKQPLEYSSNYDNTPPFPGLPVLDTETGDPISFCSFFAMGDGQPLNDALVLLDKSGSMAFQNPSFEDSPTALEGAIRGALSYYNSVREGRLAGILAFDTNFDTLEEYGPREEIAQDFQFPEPGGATDLCHAIREGAETVRAEAHSFDFGLGQLILLSDGRPTVQGCDSDDDVLQAAVDACDGGAAGNGVAINTIAFGDADRTLLKQVAEVCDANTTALFASTSSIEIDGMIQQRTTPLQLRESLTRSGRFSQSYQELLNHNATLSEQRDDHFIVPPGSADLIVEWMGDGFRFLFFGDIGGVACHFGELDFALVSPAGDIIEVSATPIPDENDYLSRTIRVTAPEPGQWTARIAPRDLFVCYPGSETSHDWGDYDPRVAVVASVLNTSVEPSLSVSPTIAPRDGTVQISAAIEILPNSRANGIDATARVIGEDGSGVVVTLTDDGAEADETAGDGIHTGSFNPTGAAQPPGGYRVAVVLEAEAGGAQSVYSGDDVVPGAAAPLSSVPDLRFSLEDSFVLLDCVSDEGLDACPDTGAFPTDPSPLDACAITLAPGETREGLEVETRGLPLGPRGLTVTMGVGVRTRNVEFLGYDPDIGVGRVRFDAQATQAAPDRPRYVRVGFARRSVTSRDCGEELPIQQRAVAFVCGDSHEDMHEGVLRGRYGTEISIANLYPTAEAALTTRLARSLPRQMPGVVSVGISQTLGPGQSVSIGCDEIRQRLPLRMTAQMRKGFVMIRSAQPLDITAAYSAQGHKSDATAFEIEHTSTLP